MKTQIIQNIKSIIVALILVLGVSYASAVWTNPTVAPTGGNVPAPINAGGGGTIGTSDNYPQFKTGLLTLDHLITPDLRVTNLDGSVTNIPAGSVLIADGSNTGKVKWFSPQSSCNETLKETFNLNVATSAANNSSNDILVMSLSPGRYEITGNGTTYNIGGGGIAALYVGTTPPTTYPAGWINPGTNASVTDVQFTAEFPWIMLVKRWGGPGINWTIPKTSFTLTSTQELRKHVSQGGMTGNIEVKRFETVCTKEGGLSYQDFDNPKHGGEFLCTGTGVSWQFDALTAQNFCEENGFTAGIVKNTKSFTTGNGATFEKESWASCLAVHGDFRQQISKVRCLK